MTHPPDLPALCRTLRLDVLDITTQAGSGHPSSSWSAVEILCALYFGGMLNHDPRNPTWPDRDRVILSKGHAAPLLYPVLARAGYFPLDQIYRLRAIDSPVQGHPILGLMPGVEATTGSLGQGLSLAIGHLLGARLTGKDYRAYVVLGDGECQAGQIWEAAMAAAHFKLDRLIAILDYNKFQETGPISQEIGLEPLAEKWRAFGWHVAEVDGHDVYAILDALDRLRRVAGQPSILIAHTVKGKGVSFVEADFTFHGRALNAEQAARAREELLCN